MEKNLIEVDIIGIVVFLILSVLTHFLRKYLLRRYNNNKAEIEKLKRDNPDKSYALKENINEHILKAQINTLLGTKYVFILGAVIILLRILFG